MDFGRERIEKVNARHFLSITTSRAGLVELAHECISSHRPAPGERRLVYRREGLRDYGKVPMKTCPYCGAKYPDDVVECPIDRTRMGKRSAAAPLVLQSSERTRPSVFAVVLLVAPFLILPLVYCWMQAWMANVRAHSRGPNQNAMVVEGLVLCGVAVAGLASILTGLALFRTEQQAPPNHSETGGTAERSNRWPDGFRTMANPYRSRSKTSTLASWSLGLGSLGLLLGIYLGGVLSLAAVICGHQALSDIKKGEGRLTGSGVAKAGLLLGYLAIVWFVIWLLVMGIAVSGALK